MDIFLQIRYQRGPRSMTDIIRKISASYEHPKCIYILSLGEILSRSSHNRPSVTPSVEIRIKFERSNQGELNLVSTFILHWSILLVKTSKIGL